MLKERRYDIDWLRVLIMLAVFFSHCARFFGGGRWHLNNAKESIAAHLFTGWLDMWFMPLFFLLSGIGSWYALRSRNNGQYLLERSKRILIPLYTVGLFLLLPIQYYFEIVSNKGFQGSFWEMLPHYFKGLTHVSFDWPGDLLPFPFSGHLWFLLYLYLISLAALPLLNYLRSKPGLRFVEVLAGISHRWGGIFIFLVPLILIRVGLRSIFPGMFTWAGFFEFSLFFIMGSIITADSRFTEGIKKHGWMCLIIGIVCFGGEGYYIMGTGYNYANGEPFSLRFVFFETMMSLGRWSWIVFVLSLGAKYLNFKNRVLTYANEAVLPFYIFHQTIILCIGYFVIHWNMSILLKYIIISSTSFALIMFLYELMVRRFNTVRLLFGMSTRRSRKLKGSQKMTSTENVCSQVVH
jgi:hypothetical protein